MVSHPCLLIYDFILLKNKMLYSYTPNWHRISLEKSKTIPNLKKTNYA
jgi:hypothetical protein